MLRDKSETTILEHATEQKTEQSDVQKSWQFSTQLSCCSAAASSQKIIMMRMTSGLALSPLCVAFSSISFWRSHASVKMVVKFHGVSDTRTDMDVEIVIGGDHLRFQTRMILCLFVLVDAFI